MGVRNEGSIMSLLMGNVACSRFIVRRFVFRFVQLTNPPPPNLLALPGRGTLRTGMLSGLGLLLTRLGIFNFWGGRCRSTGFWGRSMWFRGWGLIDFEGVEQLKGSVERSTVTSFTCNAHSSSPGLSILSSDKVANLTQLPETAGKTFVMDNDNITN